MRFMAIIGLCLMAVFALVQSIPVQKPDKPVQVVPAATVRQAIQNEIQQASQPQHQQVQKLQVELDALKSEKDQTQVLLAVAQQRYEQVIGQVQQAREVRERQELVASKQPSPSQAEKAASNKPPPVPDAPPAEKPQGFTLRFASATALDRLITAGSVSLYGMADQQAWRLSMQAGGPAVARTSLPGSFHEMAATTVPAYYIRSLDDMADGPGPTPVVWGVQLPPSTRVAITTLVEQQQAQGEQGGTLVIQDNGQVLLEE
jgi:Skp family chaperone for outer membrane proteins